VSNYFQIFEVLENPILGAFTAQTIHSEENNWKFCTANSATLSNVLRFNTDPASLLFQRLT